VDSLTSERAEVSRKLPAAARQPGAFAKRACGLAALLIFALPGIAAAQPVDLSLVLAVDVSGSIDAKRYDLQQEGLANAFSSDAVIAAIRSGEHQRIAVTVVEWSGPDHQLQSIPWTVIEDAPGARAFASAIAALPRAYADFTSISGAIEFSTALLAQSGASPTRRVIDVSGDGTNNSGGDLAAARSTALAHGITINGLAILASEPELDSYYEQNVMAGDDSFVTVASNFEAFSSAMMRKLVREIAAVPTFRYNLAAAR
jgi:hypothetical protein